MPDHPDLRGHQPNPADGDRQAHAPLRVRRFTRNDLQLVLDLDADPAVKRFIDNGAPVDHQEIAEQLNWWLGYYDRFDGYGFWAAFEKPAGARDAGEFLGWFHFRPGDGVGQHGQYIHHDALQTPSMTLLIPCSSAAMKFSATSSPAESRREAMASSTSAAALRRHEGAISVVGKACQGMQTITRW